MQVAETERELVGRLVSRKTEPLVMHLMFMTMLAHVLADLTSLVNYNHFCIMLWRYLQDSMLIRIQTAREEMDAVRDFDYGANQMPMPAVALHTYRSNASERDYAVCSCGEPREPAGEDRR